MQASENAVFLKTKLQELAKKHPEIMEQEIRGLGFFVGIKIKPEFNNLEVRKMLFHNDLAVMGAQNNVLRLLPPLDVTQKTIAEAVECMDRTFANLKSRAPVNFDAHAGALAAAPAAIQAKI